MEQNENKYSREFILKVIEQLTGQGPDYEELNKQIEAKAINTLKELQETGKTKWALPEQLKTPKPVKEEVEVHKLYNHVIAELNKIDNQRHEETYIGVQIAVEKLKNYVISILRITEINQECKGGIEEELKQWKDGRGTEGK